MICGGEEEAIWIRIFVLPFSGPAGSGGGHPPVLPYRLRRRRGALVGGQLPRRRFGASAPGAGTSGGFAVKKRSLALSAGDRFIVSICMNEEEAYGIKKKLRKKRTISCYDGNIPEHN